MPRFGFFRLLRQYLVSGFFTLVPVGVSLLFIFWIVRTIDSTITQPVDAALGFHFPGLGLLIALVAMLLAGILTSNVLGERLLELIEEGMQRIPVYKWVYATVKQMMDAFSPESKSSFKSVVVVEYPRKGVYSLGFVTNEVRLEGAGGGKTVLAVYIPTNHVYFGEIALIPKEEVIATGMSIQQGIQCSLSAGAAIPPVLGAGQPT